MSKNEETPKVLGTEEPAVVVNTPAPVTEGTLLKMLLDTQNQLAAALKDQADAIRESRKPYVDPNVLAGRLESIKMRREETAKTLRTRQIIKKSCPHRRTNSDGSFHDKLNIKWMMHSNGIILGVCGTCHSQFDPQKYPNDKKWLQISGDLAGSKMGRANDLSVRPDTSTMPGY